MTDNKKVIDLGDPATLAEALLQTAELFDMNDYQGTKVEIYAACMLMYGAAERIRQDNKIPAKRAAKDA